MKMHNWMHCSLDGRKKQSRKGLQIPQWGHPHSCLSRCYGHLRWREFNWLHLSPEILGWCRKSCICVFVSDQEAQSSGAECYLPALWLPSRQEGHPEILALIVRFRYENLENIFSQSTSEEEYHWGCPEVFNNKGLSSFSQILSKIEAFVLTNRDIVIYIECKTY